jgi:hypothetical protein
MKIGCLTDGSERYDVYRTAFDPGAESCASNENGKIKMAIEIQKRTGNLNFLLLTVSAYQIV